MMDKQRIRARFSKAASNYQSAAVAQYEIAKKMIRLMQEKIQPRPQNVLEIGCGTGLFSRLILQHIKPKKMVLNDICPEMMPEIMDILTSSHTFSCADAETYAFPKDINLIASCSTIQWFNNPRAFFENCYASLPNSGILAFSTFGHDNMHEINATAHVGLTYQSKSALIAELLALNYTILIAQEEHVQLYFESPLQVLAHLKQTGVTGIKNHRWTKGTLRAFCDQYTCRYGTEKGVSLTYHPIYIIAKKTTAEHANHQQSDNQQKKHSNE
jgi:malonyl-ACP O-methyltransferase BioC